jgi:hypothetical protein
VRVAQRYSRRPLPPTRPRSFPDSFGCGSSKCCETSNPAFVSSFKNVHRFYDEKSRAVAIVSCKFCDAEEIWAITTCMMLCAGKQETMVAFCLSFRIIYSSFPCRRGLAGILKRPGTLSDGIFRDPAKIAGYVALPSQNWTRDIFIGALKEELSSEQRLLDGVRTVMLKKNRANVIRFLSPFVFALLASS